MPEPLPEHLPEPSESPPADRPRTRPVGDGADVGVGELVRALQQRDAQLQQIIDLVPMIIFAKDWAGRFLLANKALADAYGVTVDEIVSVWQGDLPGPPGQVSRMLHEDRAVMRSGRPKEIPRRAFRDAQGVERILHVTKVPFVMGAAPANPAPSVPTDHGKGDHGKGKRGKGDRNHHQRLAVVGVAVDVTERLQAEERFEIAIEAAPAGMLMTDRKGTIVLVNHEIERMFGYARRELVGQHSKMLVPERLHDRQVKLRERFLAGRRRHEAVRGRGMFGRRKDGSEFPVELAMNTVRTKHGRLILSSVTDVTERRRQEEEIHKLNREMEQRVIDRTRDLAATNERLQAEIAERRRAETELMDTKRSLERANELLAQQALRDTVTSLPNRRAFDAHLVAEMRRAARPKDQLAVLMIDVDHFKGFNDRYGHPAGDRCLAQVGAALNRCMRRPTDFAARYGGEEFATVLADTDVDGARVVAETIRKEITAHTGRGVGIPPVTVSIGLAVLTIDVDTEASDLVDAADRALYRAKQAGRNQVVVSSERSA